MNKVFNICFCFIIKYINFSINIFTKWLILFRKILARFIRIINKIMLIFFINPAIKWTVTTFSFYIKFIALFLDHFFYPKFFLISFVELLFKKGFSNFFTIEIANNICLWNCNVNLFNSKNFFCPIWCISVSKNMFVLIFLHDHQL